MVMNFQNQEHQQELRNAAMEIDKTDLLAILEIRFGDVPADVVSYIESITDSAALERFILVAANVPDWESMYAELTSTSSPFGIVGELFNPISTPRKEPVKNDATCASTAEADLFKTR